MGALSTLCDIITQGAKVLKSSYARRVGFNLLLARGFVREKGVVQSVVCNDCEMPHDAEIVFRDGCYGYFCPDLGFLPVPDKQITAIVADPAPLIAELAELFHCQRRKTTPVHGETWRIGAVETHEGDLTIYFHPRLQSGTDARDLETALRDELASPYRLVLTANGTLRLPNITTAHLAEVVHLDLASQSMYALARLAGLVGAPESPKDGRPNEFRNLLFQIYSTRKNSGQSLNGRNAEASAILCDFKRLHPNERAPALSVVRRYVTKFRHGS